jgi:hypothetical protein
MNYWSTKILITRPCVCRLERRIQNQSNMSASFDAKAAGICVNAAMEMVKLFPNQPNVHFIYSKGPWWVIVHIIMQSMAVLLLEMTYSNEDPKRDDRSIILSIKKLIRWLKVMRDNDLVAARAFEVIWRILKICAPTLQAEANELLADDKQAASQDDHSPYSPNAFPQQTTAQWQQTHFPMPGYLSEASPDSAYRTQTSMPFGNPFFTSFDQGAPAVNIQQLWTNPGIWDPVEVDMDSAFSMDDGVVPHDADIGDVLQEQQYDN